MRKSLSNYLGSFFENFKSVTGKVIHSLSKKPQVAGALMLLISVMLLGSSELDMNTSRLVNLGLYATECDIAFDTPGLQWNIYTTYGRITENDCNDIVNRSRAAYDSARLKKTISPLFGISGMALLFFWWKRRPVSKKRKVVIDAQSKGVEPDSEKLASLESLLASGVLTNEEFQAAKKRLL